MVPPPETTVGETNRTRSIRDENPFSIDFTLIPPYLSFTPNLLVSQLDFRAFNTYTLKSGDLSQVSTKNVGPWTQYLLAHCPEAHHGHEGCQDLQPLAVG